MGARALDTCATVIFRGLAVLRGLALVFTVAYVAIWWRDWYGVHPWRLLGPALVFAWGTVCLIVTARRTPSRPTVLGHVAVGCAVGLTAPWTVPDASLGDPSSWILITVMLAGLHAVNALRTRWSLVALTLLAAAHLLPAYQHRPQVITSTGLLLFTGVAMRQAVVRLRRVALAADAWLDAVGARSRAEAVAAAQARADRAHERFLHDTVLNMLAGLGLGGAGGAGQAGPEASAALARVRERCQRIVAQVERMLAGAGGEANLSIGPPAGPPADSDAELARLIAEVVEEAGDDGLAVTVSIERVEAPRWARPARLGPPAAGPARREERLPADVVTALAAALREALINVRRHAGVAAARVDVARWLDGVRVEVRDEGAGFDAARFDPARPDEEPSQDAAGPAVRADRADRAGEVRLGLRGSVHGRLADVGGWARIDSAPGEGTTVGLHWQAPRPAVAGSPDGADLRRSYERAARRAVGVALLAGVAVLALPAIAYRGHSTPSLAALEPIVPVASLLLWAVVAAGAGLIAAVTWHRPLTGPESLATLGFAVACVLAGAATTSGGEVIRIYNWAGIIAPTLLLFSITVSQPWPRWATAVAVVSGTALAVSLPRVGSSPLELVRLLGTLYGFSTLQLLVTVAGPVLMATAETTTRAAALDAELGAAQEAAAAVRRDRARRLARLDRDVLPLLRAVVDGSADPRDEDIRRLCASRARALRRMLVGSGGRAGPLAELETAIDAAEARGATVVLQVAGDLAAVPREVREQIVDLVSETLLATPPGRVMVTLLCDGAAGEGYLSYPLAAPEAAATGLDWPAAPVGAGLDWSSVPEPEPGLAETGDADPAGPEPAALTVRAEQDEDNAVVELRWPALAASIG
ncbi:ATP-binding protein [Frankia nepalensis]|uniref:ATP-binding protein n=1 Tax=Frankia nepalensis TaxID=1836974 RepID=UPI0019334299|nr:ATP-binding protein [Frankia nepalensis]MBL7497667.1 histidine kinase [Frankia nepalensis]MBL7513418.1 histidine kinase [Frankia nepalensis]